MQHAALSAIECALEMVKNLKEWNQAVKMGIGIHTGTVVAGNMGAESRLSYTSDRQSCQLCVQAVRGGRHGLGILISEEVLNSPGVKERFAVERERASQAKRLR